MTPIDRMHERLLVALTVALIAGIGALDLSLQTDAPIVALYIIPILLSLLSAEPWFTLVIIISSLSLTSMGFLPLPSDGPAGWVAPTNRVLALMTITAMACLALFYRRLVEVEKTALARQREHAAASIKTLRGLLPTCLSCHNVRDDNDRWIYRETHDGARSDALVTHHLCPECLDRLYDGLLQRDAEQRGEPLLTR